jgi:hypothetical protein
MPMHPSITFYVFVKKGQLLMDNVKMITYRAKTAMANIRINQTSVSGYHSYIDKFAPYEICFWTEKSKVPSKRRIKLWPLLSV